MSLRPSSPALLSQPERSEAQPLFDVAIIGGGIGGSCAALALARRGFEVALLEAGTFPRHKVCGEFLSPESRAVFRRLNIEAALLAAQPIPVATARVVTTSGRSIETPLPAGALALSRFRLDEILWNAAQAAGVQCFDGTRVQRMEEIGANVELQTTDGLFAARTIIAASGRNAAWLEKTRGNGARKAPSPGSSHEGRGIKRRYFGMKAHFQNANLKSGVVELHGWQGGYCGLVQVENGLTNACLLARYAWMEKLGERSPTQLWTQVLDECPVLARRMRNAERVTPWLTTANITFGTIQPTTGAVLRCGDAAGFIHPLTGDGMAMASRSGELAAAVTAAQLQGGLSREDAPLLYAAAWRREFSGRLRWSAPLQAVLTSPALTSPVLATPSLALLSRAPRLLQLAIMNTRG